MLRVKKKRKGTKGDEEEKVRVEEESKKLRSSKVEIPEQVD